MMASSKAIIEALESQDMCEQIVNEEFVKEANAKYVRQNPGAKNKDKSEYIEECSNFSNKIL
jgi:hypothetical protein